MTNSNQPDFHEPTLQQVADLCSQFGFTCAGEADLACLRAMLREGFSRYGHQPAPAAGELLKEAAWLRNECSAENADGNWISMSIDQALDLASLLERQAAPPPAEGEVGELAVFLRDCAEDHYGQGRRQFTRAADLLEQRHPAPVPAGMIPVEYWDIDSGARIVTEPSEEAPGGCWVVLNSRHVNPLTEFPTAKAAWNALQQALALPLPACTKSGDSNE